MEKTYKIWSLLHSLFPAHGFGNPQPYKIKNTGVDGPCPSYKIKNIAFEQRKTSGFWMFFGCFLDVFWMSFGCLLDVFWMSFGCLLGRLGVFWVFFGLLDGYNQGG